MKHYTEQDWKLQGMLEKISILENVDPENLNMMNAEHVEVYYPEGEYTFLHEAAIIEYHGVLYASWYNCTELELEGRTPIRGRRSYDGGKTWSQIEVIADDDSGRIMYCPPIYGVSDDKLYMMINQMVAPDHMHALDLYVLNPETDAFECLWSRPIPFKLNTNVYQLPNGKLLLPGRIAELDQFPNTPAVMISDSGKMDAQWRVVNIAPDGNLPDGHKLIHPELSAVVDGETVYIFCRDDESRVPLLYISRDCGEHWSQVLAHDIPFAGSKIYSGTLSNGRNYVIGNIWSGEEWGNSRSKLAIFFSKPGEFKFNGGYLLQDGISPQFGYGQMWHYPVAHEADGKLYVIYTASVQNPKRGAVVTIIPIDQEEKP